MTKKEKATRDLDELYQTDLAKYKLLLNDVRRMGFDVTRTGDKHQLKLNMDAVLKGLNQ